MGMREKKYCAYCGEQECQCTGTSIPQKKAKIIYYCQYQEYARPCGSQEGIINVGTTNNAMYYCHKHYEASHPRNDIQKEVERRAKMFAQQAKDAGVSNYEIFLDRFGLSPSDIAKRMVNKK